MTDSNMADVTLENRNSLDSVPKKATKKRKEMNMPSIGSCKVEMLEEDNWFSWRAKMESLLKSHGVKGHIDGTDPKPTTDEEDIEMWEKEDSIAQSILLINLKGNKVAHMSQARNVKEAWENLKMMHETRNEASALIAKRTFYSMQADDGCIIPDHITEMTKKRNELGNMGYEIPDAEFKAILVMSLPKSWAVWTQSYLGAHADKGDSDKVRGYTSQELIAIIIDEYNRRKNSGKGQEKGYYAKTEKGGKCYGNIRAPYLFLHYCPYFLLRPLPRSCIPLLRF